MHNLIPAGGVPIIVWGDTIENNTLVMLILQICSTAPHKGVRPVDIAVSLTHGSFGWRRSVFFTSLSSPIWTVSSQGVLNKWGCGSKQRAMLP
jgi:hypothetical protein